MAKANAFFDILRTQQHHYQPDEVIKLFASVSEERVKVLAGLLSTYIVKNLPLAIDRRDALADYRTNPYVLLTSASVMKLSDPKRFADFLFNNKLYMGLETSFGKSIEAAFVGAYPLHPDAKHKWLEPPEKLAEFAALEGLSREEKARVRTGSAWREIDKSCVVGDRRFVTSIKSGPNTINDTQVQGMTSAIISHHKEWLAQTKTTYPNVTGLDVVIGLTYGTDRTTNNKENQILVKLLDHGFIEENRAERPGVLVDSATRSLRVYRVTRKLSPVAGRLCESEPVKLNELCVRRGHVLPLRHVRNHVPSVAFCYEVRELLHEPLDRPCFAMVNAFLH